MKAKTILTVVLSGFVLASIAYALVTGPLARTAGRGSGSDSGSVRGRTVAAELTSAADTAEDASHPSRKLVVYYFHGNVRCPTCRKFESLTDQVIRSHFSEALGRGTLQWRVVNVERTGNGHFVDDYQLYTKSVVISDMHNGKEQRWKNLEKIWELVGDDDSFIEYIHNEVAAYMDET